MIKKIRRFSKKKKILIFIPLIVISCSVIVFLSVYYSNDKNTSKVINNNQKKIQALTKKIDKINNQKNLIIDLDSDANLYFSRERLRIKEALLKNLNFVNDIKLNEEEKKAITITSKEGKVNANFAIKINLKIAFENYSKTYEFEIIRIRKDLEKFKDLKAKIDKAILDNGELFTSDNVSLISSNQEKAKLFVLQKIDKSNPNNKLTLEEKKAITFTLNPIDKNKPDHHQVSIKFGFGTFTKTYSYKFSLNQLNLKKFSILMNKINKVKQEQIFTNINDINIATNQDKIKDFIFNKINQSNLNNKLTEVEKSNINLITNSGIINHLKQVNFQIQYGFGQFKNIFIFKFLRTKSNEEKFNILRTKFQKINYFLKINKLNYLDLKLKSDREEIKKIVINEINRSNEIKLNYEEIEAINVPATSSIIDLNFKGVKIEFSFNGFTKKYSTVINFALIETDELNFNVLKNKIDKAKKTFPILFTNEKWYFPNSNVPKTTWKLHAKNYFIKRKIERAIVAANGGDPNTERLNQKELNALKLQGDYFYIIEKKKNWTWSLNSKIKLTFNNFSKEYNFSIRLLVNI